MRVFQSVCTGGIIMESDSSADYNATPHHELTSRGSTESLEHKRWSYPDGQGHVRTKSYDAVVFDVLKVAPEDFASQITLMDLPVFKSIQPDELTTCAWTTKEKLSKAPNVVAFTRRFNHVNFWVQKEILCCMTLQKRAEVLAHYIKIAKKLLELNNLHAVMAVISALQSAPIFRLSKTWSMLSKKDKASYEKIADLFSENNNRQRLRDYMSSVRLPCIPYLGLYLTDMIYIDVAHPHSGGLESRPRRLQMNNILRVISEYQQSSYANLPVLEHIRGYLLSVRYIEELQKFVEDDNYKLSLKVEPPASSSSSSSTSNSGVTLSRSRDDLSSLPHPSSSADLLGAPKVVQTPGGSKFVPSHRKSRSLGTNFLYTSQGPDKTQSLPTKMTDPYIRGQRHLLDDSVLEESPSASSEGSSCLGKKDSVTGSDTSSEHEMFWPVRDRVTDELYSASFTCQGCLKRKSVLRHGRKPTMSSWKEYWVALWGTSLLYYPTKTIRSRADRSGFKSDPSKMMSIVGWMVVMGDDPLHPGTFTLTDPTKGDVYKFRASDSDKALEWCRHLNNAAKSHIVQPPANLMSFE
ncbi:ras-specific guanine nucleotide-releasing factor RalGPS2 isoform X1 [Lingula anatina]|uniref:Ras-specific guanine nucleotide-releasing factor RalGPS2 isoform X1 n=1 Tax=Lingula anatina TaxID=7574 RepID=A0A1S3HMY9_LINAN|nr:ras-specific guanine nucleotide-releasing factor RalGPS2 isoform X1 [Lingula anatina]XP_013387433.1 ras-specific guanine nucleotide-releasing factor RalGPS2 isoform X1 [Lingula anatina]|eukprot:XP_013387432.1 ras-specific guanine nucleotide-releasing factor RalGPS2 isoform X1 [Lingula anatina]